MAPPTYTPGSVLGLMLETEARASAALDGQTFALEEPAIAECDPRPTAWIFDLDGTLFCTNRDAPYGGRDWFDYARLLEDWPIQATIDIAQTLLRAGHELLFVTARPADPDVRELTTEQLRRNFLVPNGDLGRLRLFMRETSEGLDDDLKERIYREQIEPHWAVQGVFEDSEPCVMMWQELGLTAFQVRGPHNRDQ